MFDFTKLPQELIDSILDFLINDPRSLKASSLVCRSFLRRTRVHLFRQLRFENFRHFHKFRNMCQASPHIPPRVETLALHSGWDDRKIRNTKHFVAVMSLFSNLRVIKFIHINWALLPQDVRAALSSRAFQCITFHCVTGIKASDLFSLVSASRSTLHTLKLHHTDIIGSLEQDEQSAPHVKHLTLHDSALSPELFWIDTSFLSPRHVRTLDVLLHNRSDIHRLQTLLSEGLCPLQDLVVSHMPRSIDLLNQLESSDHLQLSGLRTVTVHMWDYHSDIDDAVDRHLLEWWIGNLRQCDDIERITFCVTLGANTGDYAVWKGLDKLLLERRFPALMSVVVEVTATWMTTDVASVTRTIESQFTDARVDVISGRGDTEYL
ncbi:uncharacterized protein EV420DRAFT_211094 [Desarmillaria tabescens]|uniref:F-box domain-containing protein n=1 Tax=Armillaria tabescens TaxID=1929756 RepID=A0AA39N7H1_ARMTA|nr:uncharacterized protein EV420DRAFT_211094 [Desarmillaria tabescens]KAK0460444.1 hypothetical protein EV420DRAFT_211094 [Desarmillaria tabescens]